MKPLPMPIRLAAGLVVTAMEEVQELPRKLTELPVTAVSQALQASMRLQQRVTELAIKGDRALGALRPVPETPTWARFDEDEEMGGPTSGNGLHGYELGRDYDPPRRPTVTPVRILPDPDLEDDYEPPVPLPRAEPDEVVAAGDDDEPDETTGTSAGAASGPPGLTGYEEWSLPQLRGRFRSLSREQLESLLDWETAHRDRPPYVTMLSNRIAALAGR
jgi:hypothetical protein